jgi:chondroitin 4-sulfotransferase 11
MITGSRQLELAMLFSRERKFIFIHIQKTAGTSVEVALASIAPDGIRRFDDLPESHDPLKNRHLFASDLKKYLDEDIWNSYYKFAFVRNPWSRLVSWYNMCIERPTTPFMRLVKREANTFEEFLNLSQWRAERTTFNQADYVTDAAGGLIVDFVGRFERITEDFRTVCEHLHVDLKLPHKNRGIPADYRTYYNHRTRQLVAGRFARDIEMFGYSFEDGDEEVPARTAEERPQEVALDDGPTPSAQA